MTRFWHEAAIALHTLVGQGGWVVAVQLALSVVAGAVVLRKTWQLGPGGMARRRAIEQALALCDAGQAQAAARQLAQSTGGLARLAVPSPDPSLHGRLMAEADTLLARLDSGLRLLESIGQISPLLGLYGTVLGMIEAFQAMQGAGASVDPSVLAGGIWVALLTTAVGLAVAMPVTMVLSWFDSRVEADRLALHRLVQALCAPLTYGAPPVVNPTLAYAHA